MLKKYGRALRLAQHQGGEALFSHYIVQIFRFGSVLPRYGDVRFGWVPRLTPTPLPPLKDLVFLKYFRDLLCAFKWDSVNGAVTLFRVNSSLPSQPTQTSCLIGQCSLNKLLVSTEQMIVNCLPQIILFLLC